MRAILSASSVARPSRAGWEAASGQTNIGIKWAEAATGTGTGIQDIPIAAGCSPERKTKTAMRYLPETRNRETCNRLGIVVHGIPRGLMTRCRYCRYRSKDTGTHAFTRMHAQSSTLNTKHAHGRVPSFSDRHAPTHEPINAHSARTPQLAQNVTIGTSPATHAPPLQGRTAPPLQGWKENKDQRKAGGVMVFFSSTRAGQAGAGAGTWRPAWRSPILKSPVHSD